jgi:hypothetical protein
VRLQRLPYGDRAHLHHHQKILVLPFALPFAEDHEGSRFLLPVLLPLALLPALLLSLALLRG